MKSHWRSWLTLSLLWGASAWVWALPLLRPRGQYLWGHYQIRDIYLGLPLALATLCATLVMFSPERVRRTRALRLTIVCSALLLTVFAVDLIYTFMFVGILRTNLYFDIGGISRRQHRIDSELGFVTLPHLSWYGRTNRDTREVSVRLDENGFRNPDGIKRAEIVFLGDSFTEAPQVEEQDTYVRKVSDLSGLSVVNLGRSAYAPQQELIVLERYGFNYQPKVVVWQIFEGNDLNDAQSFVKWREDPDRAYVSLPVRYFNNSLLSQALALTIPERPDPGTVPAKINYTGEGWRPVHIRYQYISDLPAQKRLGFEETKQVIAEGSRLCKARGIRLVVVLIPSMLHVFQPYVTFDNGSDRERFLPGNTAEDEHDLGHELAGHCQKVGCDYLDLFTALRRQTEIDNRLLFFPNDEHLDLKGHEVLAREIVDLLRARPPVEDAAH